MGFFKNLFKKKKKDNEEIITDLPEDTRFNIPQTIGGIICDYCNEEICSHDKRKKFTGKAYHIKCFRRMKKDAKKVAFQ